MVVGGHGRNGRRARARRIVAGGLILPTVMVVTLDAVDPENAAFAADVFEVDSRLDAVDVNPGDGECRAGNGLCTLRAAVQEANALPGGDTIVLLESGTYRLTVFGAAEDLAGTGDLDISEPVAITGPDAATTVIDGNASDRVLHLLATAGDVTVSEVTIRGGFTEEDGGGVYSTSSGTLVLDAVNVLGNTSASDGGGVHTATGTLRVVNGSRVEGNAGRNGGGIFNAGELSLAGVSSRAFVSDSTITGNIAVEGGGGGIWNDHEGALTLTDVTVTDNFADDNGGGVGVVSKASLTVTGGTFEGNQAHGEGGAASTATERAVRITGTTFTGNEAGVPVEFEAGEGGGGALSMGGDGVVEISDATFAGNSAPGEGGAIYLDNNGSVAIADTVVRDNFSGSGGGGIENAATRVTFTRLLVTGNRAVLDGGGIESQGSGAFTIVDTTVSGNTAENGGGFANGADGSTRIERSLFWDNRAIVGLSDDAGLGGGIYSLGDAGASYENITVTGNFAQVRGGGFYVDADAGVRVSNSTIAGNSSPIASGAGGEIGSINFPIHPSQSVVFRNTIVAGNLIGPNCSFAIGSEGGNIQGDTSCHFSGPRDRTVEHPGLDAVADNGGPTMTMAIQPESLALDGGVDPCPLTDQRGVGRPQNERCDSGAFESEGPFPAGDDVPPDTQYLTGPVQDTENTSAFTFTGSDNQTPPGLLLFECRLIETEIGEPPEPPDPTEPPDPALAWLGCQNPWQVPIVEEGLFTFEVRAIDRSGNVDPTPAVHTFGGTIDLTPPQTSIDEKPSDPSFGNSAVFTFSADDGPGGTPQQFMEFECRLDTLDPDAWLECTNPAVFTNLTVGEHTFQVRAADGADNVDPTPATYTWTVAPPVDCDEANITLGAAADVFVDEETPQESKVLEPQLVVRSSATGNARALIRFPVSNDAPDCILESATLRLYSGSDTDGRTLEAAPLAAPWAEHTVWWNNQPGTTAGAPATAASGGGYREWDVTDHVAAMLDGSLVNNGWVIRDAVESDLEGGDQAFYSRETPQDPPPVTLPQLVLRFEAEGTPPPPPPPPGVAATVTCGQVVTTSIVLQNDLVGCLGEGLVIGAPDIEVDLNGHVVSGGAAIEPGEEDGLLAGIRNAGHDNVVIRNGTVRHFGYGVRIMGNTIHNIVEDMTFDANIVAGVELLDADNGRTGNTVRDNVFTANGESAVALTFGSERSVVTGNTFIGNGGKAILLQDAHDHRIEGNEISGLIVDPLIDSDGGIFLESSTGNVVRDNIVADAGDAGISLSDGSHDNVIGSPDPDLGNTVFRNSDTGIGINDSDGNRVLNNITHVNGGPGVSVGNAHDGEIIGNDARFNPGGIELAGSNRNVVRDNDVTASSAGGISVEGGLRNEIVDNVANQTRATGITVEAEAVDTLGNPIPGNLVEGNTANDNLGDGISVSAGGHEVTANAGYNNAAYGIAAGEFVVDGGSNVAAGNGEPLQCVGVVCTPGAAPPPPVADLTPPDTTILSTPMDGSSTFDIHTFTFTGADDTAPATALHFECRLDAPPDPPAEPPEPPEPGEPPEPVEPPDSEAWRECGSPQRYELLPAGEHTFEVRAIDPFDNVDLAPATFTWTVVAGPPGPDSTPPTTTIFETPGDPSTSTSATFRFRGSDNATPGPSLRYECSLDGAGFTLCTSPASYSSLDLGGHTFAVRAVDAQGNVDASPAIHQWTVVEPDLDTTAPDTTIDSSPDPTTVSTTAQFTFSSTDDSATFECSLDGDPFQSCTSPTTYGSLGVGAHTFDVRAVDPFGNTDPTPAPFGWTITPEPVPTTVSCGQVLLQSTLLNNDLLDCPGDGLVIGAHGITVDLDGRAVDGTSLGYGVRNDGFDSVTITNGTVQEFDTGVHLGNGTVHNIVSDLTLQLNELAGVEMVNADDGVAGNIVRTNTIAGNGGGVALLTGTQFARVTANTIAGNAGIGAHIVGAHTNLLEHNEISGTSDASIVLEGATGNRVIGNVVIGSADSSVVVHLGANGNRIEGNHLTEGEAGIIVEAASGNELVDNVAHEMSDSGIILEEAHDNLVRGNDVRFNSGGIEVEGSTGNRIEANNASETDGAGIEIGDGSIRNVLERNVANANDAGGITIETFAAPGSGNLLDGNVTNSNTGDGIYIGDVGHMIRGNVANDNLEWGIYAADATVAGMNLDGGGNRGTGNTGGEVDPLTLRPLQCKNVVCDGGPPLASDLVPPNTAIAAAPVSPTLQTSATFRFTGSDNASSITFHCRLDSIDAADFEPCTSPVSYTALALGPHTFDVRAVDFSGNVDPTPASHTWTIEAPAPGVPPETTIDGGPDVTTVSVSATFTFSANEPGVTFECALDLAAFAACPSPTVYGDLGVGAHTFAVRAIDTEDLVDPTPATFAWTVSAPPQPGSVSCGQLITVSRRVTNDLFDCLGNGLVIGAHGITLDLDGHTIDGVGLAAGILNNDFDNVTVTNGVVQEFDVGVQLGDGTSGSYVTDMTLQLNQVAGVQLIDADAGGVGTTVRANTLVGNDVGIWLVDGTQFATVRGNTISQTSGDGILVDGSSSNRIEANDVSQSSGAGVALLSATDNSVVDNTLANSSGPGIALGATLLPANGNRIEDNRITASSGAGIAVVDSAGNEIIGNVATLGSSAGIELDGASTTLVRGNDLGGNAGGVELIESSDNRIEANNASGSNGTGISVEGGSLRNEIVLNSVSGNSGEGIYVNDSTTTANGNLIDRNIANSNSGDGIIVNGAGHTVSNNSVSFNDGWGIFASPGTVDGGGNEAAGNSEPAQCAGVVCTIGTAPGAPDTVIVDRPSNPSNSQNPLFTFIGTDDTTSLANLEFECRLDSTDPLAWAECENPHVISGLTAGTHTFEVRAVDASEQVDPTPASYTWTYVPLASGVAPDTFIDIAPPPASPLLEGVFTFSSNEPDVTFECSLDGEPFATCEFAYEFGFEETQVGQHTFQVRARDPEGNVDATPATYTWTVTGLVTFVTDGPAYTPPEGPGEPATGGETTETTAVIHFEANAADATFICSLDLLQYEACTSPVAYEDLTPGEHLFRVFATDVENEVAQLEATEYEWTIIFDADVTPPDTVIATAPASGSSDTTFTFTGSDDQSSPLALGFECRLDSTDPWFECISPFNLLVELPDFAPGSHTFEVRAVDEAEPEPNVDPTPAVHTWASVADTTPPTITLLTTPLATTVDPDVEFAFAGSDNATPLELVMFECAVDGAPFEPCDSPEAVQGLEPGEHTFAVQAVDLAGNSSTPPATFAWALVGPPVTTISAGPTSPTSSQDAAFTFAADQHPSTFACSIDGGDFLPCTSPVDFTGFTDGEHTFEVEATNTFGLVEIEPASFTWTVAGAVDTTPPTTTLTVTPAAVILAGQTVFEFVSNEVGATFECSLDGAASQTCDPPYEVSGLTDDAHTFSVRAVDVTGNVDPTPATFEWVVDLPPVTEILGDPPTTTESPDIAFEFTASEVVAGFECFLDGVITACTSPMTYTALSLGDHVFAVRAIDDTPSHPSAFEDHDWAILAPAPPNTFFVAGPPALTFDTAATFAMTGTDNLTDANDLTFECSLDEAAFVACPSPYELTELGAGLHTLEVRAVDESGLVDTSPAIYSWTVLEPDVTPPNTTITSGPPANTTAVDATITFSADEPGATFECSLDGEAFAGCESPVELADLQLGPHTFEVRATDPSGNTEPTPAIRTWTGVPDTTDPDTEIVNGPSGSITSPDVSVTFTGTDDTTPVAELDFECSLDGGPFESCDSPQLLQGLGVGAHTFAVRAVDAATNVDATPALAQWTTIDTTPPDTTIVTGPASPTEAATASFTMSSNETAVTFECSLDGDSFTACASAVEVAGLVPGDHTFRVRARDASGNVDPTPDVHEWTVVATAPPETNVVSGPPATTISTEALFTFASDQPGVTFQCSLDSAAFADCETPHELTGLPVGPHELMVRAVDVADKVDPTPATYTWTVETPVPPDTAIVLAPPATTLDTTATFTFSSNEAGVEFECSLDGASFADCESPVHLQALPLGSHAFAVRAVDTDGLVDPAPAVHSWTIQEPPPPPAQCTATTTTYTTSADSWVDQGSASSNKGTDSVLKVMSKSGANVRAFVRFSLPTNLPTGCVVESAALRLYAASYRTGRTLQALRVNGAWTEGGVTWNNQPATTGAAATTTSGSGYRSWNVTGQIQAMFDAGANNGFMIRDATEGQDAEQQFNSREKSSNRPQLIVSFTTPDTTPPETTLSGQPSDPASDGSASFTLGGSDDSGGYLSYECRLDGSAFASCTSPATYSGLTPGSHTFEVRAKDAAGNVDPTPAASTWTVLEPPPAPADSDPPETSITAAPATTTSSTAASFAFGSDESVTTFECSLDGAAFGTCSSPVALSGLAVGTHTFSVRAIDGAGNVDPTPATHAWAIALSCTSGTVTLGSVADSWVLQSSPSSNYGSDGVLKVDSKSGNNARALVRFDLPAIPAGCQVTGATLRLYAASWTTGRTLQARQVTSAWTEGGVTWNNQPTTASTSATTSSGSGWRQWNVLGQVHAMYGGTNHGFSIRDASENASGREQQFHSREKAPDSPPQLVITFGP